MYKLSASRERKTQPGRQPNAITILREYPSIIVENGVPDFTRAIATSARCVLGRSAISIMLYANRFPRCV